MAYVFPEIKREIFEKTFLKDVFVTFYFKDGYQEIGDASALNFFFKENYNLDVDCSKLNDGIEISSNDGYISFIYTKSFVSVKMKFPAYKTFDLAKKMIELIIRYGEIIGANYVDRMIIGKYNELQYKIPVGDFNVGDTMKNIFSESLLSYGYDNESFDDAAKQFIGLSRWEKKVVFNDNDSDTNLTIEYGFRERIDTPEKSGALTMKIQIEKNCKENRICDTISVAEACNRYVDSAFNWGLTEKIKENMRIK